MDVFISYTHTDRPVAAAIAGEFAKLAIEVWWDHDLMAGEDYRRRITEILARTPAVIVLWSRRSIASQWVLAEATTASERRALVPLSLDGERPPIDFRSLHTIQLDGWCPGDPLPQEVVRAVAGLLGRSLSYSTQ
ncbi:MAG TPA: toll/interleukin-1 receptor domain-containing protein, partial [Stellaceae bacterium]|nr:toll/interleukin-1 receptor domain-containing protein [Stellaceae bacterium]